MIYLGSKFGFCDGVINAINTVDEASKENKPIVLLKPLMHNDKENQKLQEKYNFSNDIKSITKESILIYPAHGHTRDEIRTDIETRDAICPMLKARYTVIENNKTLLWFYIGERNHQETQSFLSTFPFLNFIDTTSTKIDLSLDSEYGLIFQSTVNKDLYIDYLNTFKRIRSPKIVFGPCNRYIERLDEAIEFLKKIDYKHTFVYVLGSKTSSNCKAMEKTIKYKFAGIKTKRVNAIEDIDPDEAKDCYDIYLLSSTSISKDSVLEIKGYLEALRN